MSDETDQIAKPVDIYARVSHLKRKTKRELTAEGQVAVCRLRLADLGLEEGKVLVDPGRSAWNPAVKRPAWDELMDRLERGVSGGMVVFDLERFTRQPKDGERMIELAVSGLMILDSESEYDLTTPNGKKAFRDGINAAAYYSDRLSTRTSRGRKLKAMAGKPNGSQRPFGFEADLVTMREGEAEIIRELTRRSLAGESQNALVSDLEARGVLTSQGKLWTQATLRQLLTRERNCGRIIHTDLATGVTSVVGRLPGEPIVTEEEFDRLHGIFAARRYGPRSMVYLCSGIAVCGRPDCGKPLSGRQLKHRPPYDDGSVRRDYWCGPYPRGCGRLMVDQRGLDQAAEALTIEILADPRHTDAIEATVREMETEAARLDLAIARAEKVAEALADRLGRGDMTRLRYDITIRPLDERIAKLKAERAALGDPSPQHPPTGTREHWQRRWKEADTEERRVLLKMALRGRRLIIDPASRKLAERSDATRRIRIE
jgi:DNA invertase Pin-like site-specific DNA recombinase